MFQQVLLIVDADSLDRSIPTALRFSQAYGSKLSLLCLATGEDTPLLLFSELNRPKAWSTPTFHNVAQGTTIVRPATKLKVIGMEYAVLNQRPGNFEPVTEVFPESRSLETAIAKVIQLCKADFAIVNLSHSIHYSDLIHSLNCAVLVLK